MQSTFFEQSARFGTRESEILRKLKRMTLLVGLVGSDGIVLAADKNVIDLADSGDEFHQMIWAGKSSIPM
jgi:20S proteasome alpha/beta subunit